MTVSSGGFAELLWPGIAEIWGNKYQEWEPLYRKFFEVKKSDKRFEKEQGVTTLPLAGLKNEGDAIPFVDPFQGYQKEYVMATYALGTVVTREMYEDDQYNVINELPSMLAQSLRKTEETIAHNVLNRAFNSSYTGADGLALCVTNHTLVGGGTFQNTLTTAADLSQTAVEIAITDIMNFVDDQGLPIRAMPECLIVPTLSNFIARKILETANQVGSANNDVNPIKGLFSDLVVSPYITDNDSWFICTDVPHGLTWWDRRDAEITRDNEYNTQNLKFATTARFASGWTDPRGVYGSPGA